VLRVHGREAMCHVRALQVSTNIQLSNYNELVSNVVCLAVTCAPVKIVARSKNVLCVALLLAVPLTFTCNVII
jgi:hypothetical protein